MLSGSIRMTLDENSDIFSAQDYYPYGEILRSYTTAADVNSKYKYFFTERESAFVELTTADKISIEYRINSIVILYAFT
jgi:hypothetical protein